MYPGLYIKNAVDHMHSTAAQLCRAPPKQWGCLDSRSSDWECVPVISISSSVRCETDGSPFCSKQTNGSNTEQIELSWVSSPKICHLPNTLAILAYQIP